ncbi:3'-5' exonuclease [Lysinibacillus sp. 54212]|uniref:3'-5' exonuclease n=1 Tax=Lysinibacillus sp. 54212 TaxID=3119829 RepID=UPI002FC8E590
MGSRQKTYICVDIEAALIKGRQNIIEIGAVKWSQDGVMETFTQLIKPYKFKKLNQHIQKLTGIKSEQLLDAPSFKEAIYKFKRWSKGDPIFLTFGDFDRKVLEEELARNKIQDDFIFPMIDFQQKYMIANGLKEQPSLGSLMEQLGLDIQTQHRALADADSLRKIFVAVNGGEMIEEQKTHDVLMLLSSFKQEETYFNLSVTSAHCKVLETDIRIEGITTLQEKLAFSVKEQERLSKDGEVEKVQVTTVSPSEAVRKMLNDIEQSANNKVILTRTGLRSLSKILRLHSCKLPKTEVMSLQQIVKDEQALAKFLITDESVHAYEAKVCRLLRKYEGAIIEEFSKRSLFPQSTVEV